VVTSSEGIKVRGGGKGVHGARFVIKIETCVSIQKGGPDKEAWVGERMGWRHIGARARTLRLEVDLRYIRVADWLRLRKVGTRRKKDVRTKSGEVVWEKRIRLTGGESIMLIVTGQGSSRGAKKSWGSRMGTPRRGFRRTKEKDLFLRKGVLRNCGSWSG